VSTKHLPIKSLPPPSQPLELLSEHVGRWSKAGNIIFRLSNEETASNPDSWINRYVCNIFVVVFSSAVKKLKN
jgi:hypothetical protein